MDAYAFEIVGSRRIESRDAVISSTAAMHKEMQDALQQEGWGVYWVSNFDRSAVGKSLFPIRTAPPELMRRVEQVSPLYLLGMPWGTALFYDEEQDLVHYIISSPEALIRVFFSDLEEKEREALHREFNEAADVLRRLGEKVVGPVIGERYRGAELSQRRIRGRESYAEIIFERGLQAGESSAEAVEDVADKMGQGLENTFFWHVSGVAPVSESAKIVMTCHAAYARLAMQMGTYHCPALPCTTVAYFEDGLVKAAMLKPIHMFRTFFADVPWTTGIRYVRFPFIVRREIRDCLCMYLDCER